MVFVYVLWCLASSLSTGLHASDYLFDRSDHINHISSSDEPMNSLSLSGPNITVGVDSGALAGMIDLQGGRMVVHRDTSCAENTLFQSNGQLVGMRVGGVHYPQLTLPESTTAYQFPQAEVLGSVDAQEDVFPDRSIGGFDWWPVQSDICAFTDESQVLISSRKGNEYIVKASTELPARGKGVYWSPIHPVGVATTHMTSGVKSLHLFSYNQAAGELSIEPLGTHAGEVTTARWSPDGTKFVVAEYNRSQQPGWKMQVALYCYEAGEMKLLTRRYFHETPDGGLAESVYKILSCAWRADGQALLFGCGWEAEDGTFSRRRQSQVLLFDVRSDDITTAGSINNIEANVSALQFIPGQENRCLIGLSHGGGGNRLRSCTVHDNAEGIPVLERERSYPFRSDVYIMSCNESGSLLAVGNHASEITAGAVRLYKIDGLDISECKVYEHTAHLDHLAWDARGIMVTVVFSDDDEVGTLSLCAGMSLENIRVVGDSQVALKDSLHFRGRVQIDGQSRVWSIPEGCEWGLAPDSIVRVSDMVLDVADQLVISGSDDTICQLYGVTLQRGNLYCQAPVHVVTSLHAQGAIEGGIEFKDYSKLFLNGATSFHGPVVIDGTVTVEGNGNVLDIHDANFQLRPGALLRFNNTHLRGISSSVVVDETSTIEFVGESIVELREPGRFAQGTFSITQSTLIYQHWQFKVAGFTLHADGEKELWHEAQRQGVWATSGAPATTVESDGPSVLTPSGTGGGALPGSTSSTGSSPGAAAPSSGTPPLGSAESGGTGTVLSSSPVVAPIVSAPPSTSSAPVAMVAGMGEIQINTPHYYLENDLYLAPSAPGVPGTQLHISTNTTIHGNYRRIMCAMTSEPLITVDNLCTVTFVDVGLDSFLPQTIVPTGRNTTADVVWGQNVWMTLGGSGSLQLPWRMSGNAHLDGNGHRIALSSRTPLVGDPASNLVVERIAFSNVAGTNFAATADSTIMTLSNVTCSLSNTMLISVGEWNFQQEVSFVGPHAVVYQSSQPATIHDDCTFVFDNGSTDVIDNDYTRVPYVYNHSTLVYAPEVERIDGIRCAATGLIGLYNSELFCKNRSLHLTAGRIVVDGEVTLREEGDGALVLGGSSEGDEEGYESRVSLEHRSGRADIHVFGHIVMTLSS